MKGLTISVLAALALLGSSATSAFANESQELPSQTSSGHTSGGGGGCFWPTWEQQPRIVIHTAQFLAGGGDEASKDAMVDAVEQVADQFSDTDALSARITSVTTTSDPFYYGVWENDAQPTIHVRFSPQSAITADNDGKAAGGLTLPHIVGCTIKEAHIEFPWPKDKAWRYDTPWDAGERWWDTAPTYDNATWFRPSFLHELLHAFGFVHMQGVFSFMTHRSPAGFPWINRAHDNAVRILPWELGVLRDAYGNSGTSYDVALSNNWYGPPQPDDDAGSQIARCPAGSAWDDSRNACKDADHSGTRDICAGDTLSMTDTLANYSTGSVHATVKLWFSRDHDWDAVDIPSPTVVTKDVSAETSVPVSGDFSVPAGLDGGSDYYAILRVEATAQDGSGTSVHDAIPLRIPLGKDNQDRMYHHPGGFNACGGMTGTVDSTPIVH